MSTQPRGCLILSRPSLTKPSSLTNHLIFSALKFPKTVTLWKSKTYFKYLNPPMADLPDFDALRGRHLGLIGVISMGDMGSGVARLLMAHNYAVLTNVSDRRSVPSHFTCPVHTDTFPARTPNPARSPPAPSSSPLTSY